MWILLALITAISVHYGYYGFAALLFMIFLAMLTDRITEAITSQGWIK